MGVDIYWEWSTCSNSNSLVQDGIYHLSCESERSHWRREISNGESTGGEDFERGTLVALPSPLAIAGRLGSL